MPRRHRQRSLPKSVTARRSWSIATMRHQLFDFRDGFRRVQILRARLRAVHYGVTTVEPEWILQIVQPLADRLVAAVDDPTIRRQQRCRPQVAVAVPPIAGAAGRTAGAKDAGRG